MMRKPGNYTAYCGLYCSDCNRSKAEFFDLVGSLQQALAALNFDKYAAYKAATDPHFAEYPSFLRVLNGMKELTCVTCTDERNTSPCKIRKCVLEKGIAGCWDCESTSSCEFLAPLFKRHSSLAHNHRCIRKYGVDHWSDKRGKHYSWD
jgi:hypothetical protein